MKQKQLRAQARASSPASLPVPVPTTKSGLSGSSGGWFEPVFIGGFFLYVLLQINPAARSYHDGPLFLRGLEITHAFSTQPGAMLHYGTALLSEIGQTAWLGAVIITALAWFVIRVCGVFVRDISGGAPRTAQFVPGLLLLLIFNCYNAPALEIALAVAGAAGLFRCCALVPLAAWRWGAIGISVLFLDWIAGPVTAALAAILAGMHECFKRRARIPGTTIMVLGICVPVIISLVWGNYNNFKPWEHRSSQAAAISLLLYLPLAALSCRWLERLPTAAIPDAPPSKQKKRAQQKPNRSSIKRGLAWLPLACAIGACGVVLQLTFDTQAKRLLLLDYYADNHQWEDALRSAAAIPTSTIASRVQVLRALYYSGKLPSEMFAYAQKRKLEFFPAMDHGAGPEFCLPFAHLLFEMGQVNLAEHFAHESLEILGNRPETLKLIIKINIVKDRLPVARMFLGFLRQHPLYRSWADHYLQEMERDPLVGSDDEIAGVRKLLVKSDISSNNEPAFILLGQCLKANPTNRMAFEFLMANYLSSIELPEFVNNLDRMKNFDYPQLPRHYEEAVLFNQWLTRDRQPPPPQIQQIRPETTRQFARFQEVFRSHQGDREAARAAVAAEFRDSYWFYALYGFSLGPNGELTKGDQP